MIQKQFFAPVLAAFLGLCSFAQAQNAPQELLQQTITRSAQSGPSVTTRLSKNMFRTDSVQVPYTVQVPYQETETYTEQVPYTVSVPYTDYETEYRTERKCDNETRYRQERRCQNVTDYRNEQRCENRTDYRQECRNQQECHLVPGNPGQCRQVEECGTNAHGQRICKTRQVCDGGSGPRQECSNRQVCNQVPYQRQECHNVRVPYTREECRMENVPYSEYVCRDVQVPYQRQVTKYRNETRYREETRTRTVTKHRTESRCCKTEQREVFDHQEQVQVVVNFPSEAVLTGQESEALVVSLTSVNPAQVSIQNQSQLFGYRVVSQQQSGELLTVTLGLAPLFDLSNAGQQTISNLSVSFLNSIQKFTVTMKDSINHPKVRSASKVLVYELSSGQLIEEGLAQTTGLGQLSYTVQANLPSSTFLRVVVQTVRAGSVVSNGQISFTNEKVYDKKTLSSEDIAILSDSSQVQLVAPSTFGMGSYIKLTDRTDKFDNVQTVYTLSLFETTTGSLKSINTPQRISRAQAESMNNQVTLSQLLANSASKYLVSGRRIRAQIQVNRTVTDFSQQNPTPFVVVVDMIIQ